MSAIDTLLETATAMNTAKQAMENLEYLRGLLEEKQAGFSTSVELAVSLSTVRSRGRRKRWN